MSLALGHATGKGCNSTDMLVGGHTHRWFLLREREGRHVQEVGRQVWDCGSLGHMFRWKVSVLSVKSP